MSSKFNSVIKIIFILLFFTTTCPTINKTFLKFGSTGHNQVLQKNMTSYFIHKNKLEETFNVLEKKQNKQTPPYSPDVLQSSYTHNNFFISTSIFYMQSDNSTALAKYFFPNGKTELTVKGNKAANDTETPDIFAEWLGIPSSGDMDNTENHTFSSKIKISPKLEKIGTIIHIHKTITKNFWISLFLPFEEVKTNANLKEYDITGERNINLKPNENEEYEYSLYFEEPFNATQAFVHPLMKYGKIDNKTHRLSGLADINLKAGMTKRYKNKLTFDFYANVIFPTSHKPTAEYLFEPIVGNAKHWGTGFGSNLNVNLNKNFTFISSFDYQYLFRNEEKRSFDLKENGPWSRYMAATLNLPRTRPERLINYLTVDADVTPGSIANFLCAIHSRFGCFNLEIGTNIEGRAEEEVGLKREIESNVGIAWYDNGDTSQIKYNQTYSNAKINSPMFINPNTEADTNFKNIISSNLDLKSATPANQFSFNLYSALGIHGKLNKKPFLLNIGGNYNTATNNTELESWTIWGKINISI